MTVRNVFGEVRRPGRAEGLQIGKAEGMQIGEARGMQIGKAEGMQIGEARGRVNMLVSLVSDGSLPLDVAAKKAGMSEEEFKIRMQEQERSGEA